MVNHREALDDIIIDMCLERGSTIFVKIEGGSMLPLIKSSDVLGISTEHEDIRQGSIILFRSADRMIAHRVIKIHKDMITTKGDASIYFDIPVPRQNVIGRAIFIETMGRRINIDTQLWKLIDYILVHYSCVCGILLGRTIKGDGITATHHTTRRITGAINMLLPALIYAITRRI